MSAEAFEHNAKDIARKLFEKLGTVDRMALVDDEAGLAFTALPVAPLDLRRRGDAVIGMFKASLRSPTARGVALVMEVWSARCDASMPRSAIPEDLSTYAGRTEDLLVVTEHYELDGGATRLWRAPITRDAAGAPTLGTFVLDTGSEVRGQCVKLLAPRGGDA